MTRKSTARTKLARLSVAALGLLLIPGAYATPAADSADTRATRNPRYGYSHEAVLPAPRTFNLAPQYRAAEAAPGLGAPVDASLSAPLARPEYAFGRDLQLSSGRVRQGESEVLLRNSDALVRAKLRVTLGREWLFVYGDMGPPDSALRWQGLLGIRVGHGASLLGGWRRVTYYFSPGRDFDSLDSDGPFLGAQRAW